MTAHAARRSIAGPAGTLECAVDEPAGALRGVAVLCHPHPQHGGTMDNKVVMTLARTFVGLGRRAVRFNFRGVGASEGRWDDGAGELEDALAVVAAFREPALPLALAGFSFGASMAGRAAARLAASGAAAAAEGLVLVGPAVENFPPEPVPEGTLIVHGEADEVVPLAAVLAWAREPVRPVTVVPGCGHFFHGQLTLLKQLVAGAWAQRP